MESLQSAGLCALIFAALLVSAQGACGPYNPTFNICCNGRLQFKGSNSACCGTQAYNPTFNICCNGRLQFKGSNRACCGTTAYNPTFNICCNGRLYFKGFNTSCGHAAN